jgi:hypothetical protein
MDIQEYEALHGKVWRKGLQQNWCWHDLREGMLQFTPETATVLAGEFEGGFAYFRASLFLNNPHPKTGALPLESAATELEHYRRWHGLMPKRFGYGERAQNEEHLQKRLLLLTDKERAEWDDRVTKHQTDYATIETPYRLFVAGTDDASWSKFYATEGQLNEELALYEACQPLHFFNDLTGFVFTN